MSLARATRVRRGTVYEVTNRLIDSGFIKVIISGGRRHFIAEDPRAVAARYKEYSETFSSQLPEFLAIQNASEIKPKITYFEGEDEVWKIYDDTLKQDQIILSYTSVIDMNLLLDPKNIENYIRRRVERRIPVKIIALDSEVSRQWKVRGREELREIRLIPKERYNFSADVEIYGNKVAVISYKEKVFGIIIESDQISQMYRSAFELMWQWTNPYNKL